MGRLKNLLVVPLLIPPLTFNPSPKPAAPSLNLPAALDNLTQDSITQPQFPNMTSNYIATIVIPAQKARQAACDSVGGTLTATQCLPPPPPPTPIKTPQIAPQALASSGELFGTLGYALAFGNCVDEPGVNGAPGNPISWPALTQDPRIGESALFYFNHVAVITGIWSNGDIEVRQHNWHGTPITRFPRSMFRGFR